jgi:hypothetical protein
MKKNAFLFAGKENRRIFTPVITTKANKMTTTTQIQNAKIITKYNGQELVEAVLIGNGRKLDCYKKPNGNFFVSLEKFNADFFAGSAKVLRTYELKTSDFFAYWDKKLNEWK